MIDVANKTPIELQHIAFDLLKKELGVVGFIRFVQQFDRGSGNYVEEREALQEKYTVQSLVDEIMKEKNL